MVINDKYSDQTTLLGSTVMHTKDAPMLASLKIDYNEIFD
jgi:hypothetical protein